MNSEMKAQIARITLSLLILVVSLFLLGIVVSVVCSGLQINPFRETTTSFLIAAFIGLIGAAVVLVLLNVATNISLIADVQTKELVIESGRSSLRKWFWGFTVAAVVLVGLILGGTYVSKERYVKVVREQANEVLQNNRPSLDEISQLLANGTPEDLRKVAKIGRYLGGQRADLPQLSIVFSGKFGEKPALYYVSEFSGYEEPTTYVPPYFACMPNQDCEYTRRFFSGENVDVLEKYHFRGDEFYIYVPFVGKEVRYILLFQRQNSYGKIGS